MLVLLAFSCWLAFNLGLVTAMQIWPPRGPGWPPLLNFTTFQQNELKFSINAHIASLLMLASIRFGFGHMNANMAPQGLRLAPHAFFGHISIKMSLHFQ